MPRNSRPFHGPGSVLQHVAELGVTLVPLLLGNTYQGLQLLAVYEVHLCDEVIEVFVAGVDVGLCTHHNDSVEVVDVDMDEDTEKAAQDLLADLKEVLWERDTYRRKKKRE